jgi:hypothetical protein
MMTVIASIKNPAASGRGMEADLPPNLKIRIAGFSFRRRAAGNLTHIRFNEKTYKSYIGKF